LETSWSGESLNFAELPEVIIALKEIENDNLIVVESNKIKITEEGRPFVRNICMAFDLHLKRKSPETNLFSMTV
jgi:oxygen-independent coproporphyrinogen-3 oxidase